MRAITLSLSILLAACAGSAPDIGTDVDVLLLGEQHDATQHPHLQREWVERLAAQGRLAALALEMAERGRSTQDLPRDASEAAVREALAWHQAGWPWERYGPLVMTAVRAGVPVLGANLPRGEMRTRMKDDLLDTLLPPAVLATQREAIRTGHCNLLPREQEQPMVRVQVARDVAMAATLAQAARPGATVLLVAGFGHVLADRGIPLHLPPALRSRSITLPKEPPARDYCADLRQQLPAVSR